LKNIVSLFGRKKNTLNQLKLAWQPTLLWLKTQQRKC